MSDCDTTATFHVPKAREEVELVLMGNGFKKDKGSNQYVGPGGVSIFLTREKGGTEAVYWGPESEVQEYEDLLKK